MNLHFSSISPVRFHRVVLTLVLALAMPLAAHAVEFSLEKKGFHVDAGKFGKFWMVYPIMFSEKGLENHKILSVEPSGTTATIKYDGGGIVVLDVSGGEIAYTFQNFPPDVKYWKDYALIDLPLLSGGTYQVGAEAAKPMPVEMPANNWFFNTKAEKIVFTSPQGVTLTFETPDPTYAELFDNRKWGPKNYNWSFHTPVGPDTKGGKIKITVGEGAAPAPTAPAPAAK